MPCTTTATRSKIGKTRKAMKIPTIQKKSGGAITRTAHKNASSTAA
jgi:hypothetical protein